MADDDSLIAAILDRAGLRDPRRRREIERELRSHLEDARSAGHDARLGDPEDIGAALAAAYWRPWRTVPILLVGSLASSALLVVAAHALTAFPYDHLMREVLFYTSLALGYIAVYVQRTPLRGFAAAAALALSAGAVAHVVTPGEAAAPAAAVTAGAAVCLLTRTGRRFAWIWASELTLVVFRLIFGPLTVHAPDMLVWHLFVWLMIALSCYAMTLMSTALE